MEPLCFNKKKYESNDGLEDYVKRLVMMCAAGVMAAMFVACAEQTITLAPQMCEKPGRMLAPGEIPTPADVALDAYCAAKIIGGNAPDGAITIFGSARTKPGTPDYEFTREFAFQWTKQYGEKFPILTGGGPGMMAAGNQGAKEAGGKSLYLTSYFKGTAEENKNEFVTDGYVCASFAQREADLVDYGAAIVIAPGGVGTAWEIFESLSKIQTHKKNPCPVIFLGSEMKWQPFVLYMKHLADIGTISPEDLNLYKFAATPEEAVKLIADEIVKTETK